MSLAIGPVSWERMVGAVEKVRDRLTRTTAALDRQTVPYAVIGENAVAAWVSRVDETAVRNTQDVDILIRRVDLPAATVAMTAAGFRHQEVAGADMFFDGETAGPRDAVHVVFAGEFVQTNYLHPTPQVTESEDGGPFRVLSLDALVRMKLTSYRRKDQMHLLDLMAVGLIDTDWPARLPTDLAVRLQELLEDPNG
ncbi:hypothetical protein [Zavarzinella formosa]|uniref:hypothetical protein n=1 Tax=Zavarzinella formosa TaxID=360055 RepID=UPI0002F683C7|nr:hypothetical protein [Zavarzinella formosa]